MSVVERLDPETTEDEANKCLHLERYEWAAERISAMDRWVLDFACGVGYGSALIAERCPQTCVIGVDQDVPALELARSRYGRFLNRVMFVHGCAEVVMWAPHSFDAVVCLETIEHLRDPHRFLACASAWLKGFGQLVVSAPVREAPGQNPFHLQCFREDTFRELVSARFHVRDELVQGDGAYLTLLARPKSD